MSRPPAGLLALLLWSLMTHVMQWMPVGEGTATILQAAGYGSVSRHTTLLERSLNMLPNMSKDLSLPAPR